MTIIREMDSDDDTTNNNSCNGDRSSSPALRQKALYNEMRSFRNRGFHDGYDDGKKAVIQEAFDSGYKKAFEQNFILSTLKGVANALKSSYNLNNSNSNSNDNINTSSASSNKQHQQRRRQHQLSTSSSSTSSSSSTPTSPTTLSSSSTAVASSSSLAPSPISSASSTTSTNAATTTTNQGSSNHLSILESMKFDETSDIESIKEDLIKICRENRLDILAHYVSQIR